MKKIFYKHIALIGIGNIGIRHLQGLTKIKSYIKISIIDIDSKSLKNAQNHLLQLPINNKIIQVNYFKSIKEVNSNIDLAIISTNSFERLNVIRQLLKYLKIKYIVIEKVAFQSVNDFKLAINLLKKNKIKTWVNCSGRIQKLYIFLKKKLITEKKITIYCSSNGYNIGSNAIHLLDRLVFFANSMISKIDLSSLEKKIYKSKRKNYIEFKGCFIAYTKRGDKLTINDEVNQNSESFLIIDTYNYKIFIYPSLDKAFLLYRKNNWKILKINYESLLQSNLTNNFVKDINLHGKCGLTTINESFLIHKKMLEEFIKFTNKIRNKKCNSCMIT